MKKQLSVAAVALSSFILFYQNCTTNSFTIAETEQSSLSSNINLNFSNSYNRNDSNVKYFGFYATAFDRDLIDQVKHLSNMIHIDHSNGDIEFITAAILKAKENNLYAVVSVQNIFYECSDWNCVFKNKSDSLAKWKQLKDFIIKHNLSDSIFSFYTDEPEMYARIRQEKAKAKGINLKIDFIAELEEMASIIKSDLPGARLQMTSAAFDVHSEMRLPTGFDIFGMDCYSNWDSCGESPWRKSIPEYYKILSDKINSLESKDGKTRFLALLPPSFHNENIDNGSIPTKNMALELFDKYVQYSKENSKIIVMMPFLWPNLNEGGKEYKAGANFPELIEKVQNYYSGFSQSPKYCLRSLKPTSTAQSNCEAGFTGSITKSRNINCDNGIWITDAWKIDKNQCQKITQKAPPNHEVVNITPIKSELPASVVIDLPAPADPVIIRGGTGCDDNLCLWVIASYITPNYKVLVRDPLNYSRSNSVNFNHGLLVKAIADGTYGVSFRIPTEYLSIYLDRGLDVILINLLNGKESSYHYRFNKP